MSSEIISILYKKKMTQYYIIMTISTKSWAVYFTGIMADPIFIHTLYGNVHLSRS
jgi:hypothetical protein